MGSNGTVFCFGCRDHGRHRLLLPKQLKQLHVHQHILFLIKQEKDVVGRFQDAGPLSGFEMHFFVCHAVSASLVCYRRFKVANMELERAPFSRKKHCGR